MANEKRRQDPAGPLRAPEQTMPDHDIQYRSWVQYKAASNALTNTPPKPAAA